MDRGKVDFHNQKRPLDEFKSTVVWTTLERTPDTNRTEIILVIDRFPTRLSSRLQIIKYIFFGTETAKK